MIKNLDFHGKREKNSEFYFSRTALQIFSDLFTKFQNVRGKKKDLT